MGGLLGAAGGVLSAIFWGVVTLSLLVFVHEGGHYLAARACGMRVTEFYLGMPCRWRLYHTSKKYGTQIGVTPILLGGYTRICGMEGSSDDLMADVLAFVQERGRVTIDEVAECFGIDADRACSILATLTDWAAIHPWYDEEAGERPGQSAWPEHFETLARDGHMRTAYDRGCDLSEPGSTADGEPRPIAGGAASFLEAERGRTYQGYGFGKRVLTLFAGPAVNLLLAFLVIVLALSVAGVDVAIDSNVIGGVEDGSLAQEAGIQAGDRIVQIAGQDVSSWSDITKALHDKFKAGTTFTVDFEHEGARHEAEVQVPAEDAPGTFGIRVSTEHVRPSLAQSAAYALNYGATVASFAARLLMPQHVAETMQSTSSIVGISAMASEAASSGPLDLALFIAAISMSLGVMNLLPIPPLDGGKILIEIVQLAIRRPVSMRVQTIISYVGLGFFMVLFVFALRNDITNVIGLG